MGKALALFLDGTWNNVASDTNVLLLYNLSRAHDAEGRQKSFYDAGVGTGLLDKVRGGALGYGLSRNVVEAYDYIRTNFVDGDRLYVFGFSRGAYTARSLTGLIAKCGLLRDGARLTSEQLYRRYQNNADARPIWTLEYLAGQTQRPPGDTELPLTEEEKGLLRDSRRVPIKFVGVWDTAGALGIPFGNIPGLSRRALRFHHTRLSNLFEHSYHALAIDEHREAFQPTLWTHFTPKVPNPPGIPQPRREVEQRWFVGAHADVGGGCPGALPTIALHWLAEKAAGAGLALGTIPRVAPMAALDRISDSYKEFMFGLYRFAKGNRRYYRTIGAPRIEKAEGWVDTVNETIDASVFDRLRADPSYRPPSLTDWAARRRLSLEAQSGTVDAGGVTP